MKFGKIWNILFRSSHPDHQWKQTLFFMACVVIIFYLFKYYLPPLTFLNTYNQEGFEQRDPYVLQLQDKSYDPFYADIYEILHPTSDAFINDFVDYLENETQPSHLKSTFLDIGCGSGKIISEISNRGYRATGIDISPAMTEKTIELIHIQIDDSDGSKLNIPLINPEEEFFKQKYGVKCQNVISSPNIYDEEDFSHILCLGPTTLYEICSSIGVSEFTKPNNLTIKENFKKLIQNTHKWLKRGGYFVIQIEPLENMSEKWIKPTGGETFYYPYKKRVSHPDQYQTHISFSNVDYTLQFIPPLHFPSTNLLSRISSNQQELEYYPDDHGLKPVVEETPQCASCAVIQETFVNRKSQQVRQNEWRLYTPFDNTEDMVQMIEKRGFLLTKAMGVSNLAGIQPRIYLFQKI